MKIHGLMSGSGLNIKKLQTLYDKRKNNIRNYSSSSGSKTAQKNILLLSGKPLIFWSINAGKKSKYIDKLVVTSEDKEILELSKKYDVQTIVRPKELATDGASSFSVVKHVVETIKKHFHYIVLLQPTSPLREEIHIDEAIESLIKNKSDAIISVCEMDYNPLLSNVLPVNNSMQDFIRKEIKGIPTHSLTKYYRVNGAIYICKTTRLLNEKTFFIDDNIYAYK